ncbi:hypothetical protein ACWKSP_20950 [Micromonosporaceae bacterium Da 78-11]
MTDSQMKDRVKLLLRGGTAEAEASVPVTAPTQLMPQVHPHYTEHTLQLGQPQMPQSDPALQVLTLAQRTAEEHISAANRHADKTRMDAQAAAERVALDAQLHANRVRVEADRLMAEARAAAELTTHEASIRAEEIRREAAESLESAREQAEVIVDEGREHAEQLKVRAQQKYEDAVGGLGLRREALQQQIEALEVFDGDYRKRLTAFMQGQLRALWAEQPQVAGELEVPVAESVSVGQPGGPVPADEDG